MAGTPKSPQSFKDALVEASQSIAGGVGSADYDSTFAGHLLNVIGQFIQAGHQKQQQQSQQAAGGGGAPPPGGPGAPPPGGGVPGAGGPPGPAGDSGSAPPGGGAQTPPAAPTPGGMSQGLTPSPDEMRRVLADVAGK